MKHILLKSAAVAFLSVAASILLVLTIVPALGGVVDGNAWKMVIICPLAIAWPASAYTFWQSEKLRRAHIELERAHAKLAQAHRNLEEKSRLDVMTGMLNREAFFAVLEKAQRKTDTGALLIIDADHFKRINDSYGHLTGDKALLEIAAAIRSAVRSGDILGRIGGEEFAALLSGANEEEATRVAERIRQHVERICFMPDQSSVLPITVSIGGTICVQDATVSELMRAADKRLYQAKNRGRNLAIVNEGLPAAA